MSDLEYKDTTNVVNETLVVGSLWREPKIFVDYSVHFTSKYDFSDVVTRFLYETFEIYYTTFSEIVTPEKVNTFMASDETRLARFNDIGGYETIRKWMERSDPDDFSKYFDTLKKYAYIQRLDRFGFNVQRVMAYKSFDKMSADDLYRMMSGLTDRIYTEISAVKDSVSLGEDMPETVVNYLEVPQMGIEYPWKTISEMFRGMRLGKLVLNGFLSNEGKSRNLMMLVAWVALVKKEKFLLMSNEMSEEDLRSALITTVLNNEEFQELHGVKMNKEEKEIVLGLYRDKNGNFLKRRKDDDGNFIETQEDFVSRVSRESEEFRNIMKVSEWIDEHGSENILFKDVGSGYSDKILEHEIRRHSIVHGVKYFGYDTLKGYKVEDWQSVKQTATRLKEIMKELNTFMWAVFQLTDDTVFTNFFDLSSNNIASSKHIKHVADYLLIGKRIPRDEYHLYEYIPINEWGEAEPRPLDPSKKYFGSIADKNRGGSKEYTPLFEYNLDFNIWKNIGSLQEKTV